MLSLSEGTNPPSQAGKEENTLLITHFSARFHSKTRRLFSKTRREIFQIRRLLLHFPTSFFLKTLENQSQNSRKLFFLLTLFIFFPYFFHDRSCTELALLVHFNHFERFLKVFFPKRQISDEKISTTGRDFRQYYHVFTLTLKFGFDKS